jgi:serine/threonine protein phosphatase PrpC
MTSIKDVHNKNTKSEIQYSEIFLIPEKVISVEGVTGATYIMGGSGRNNDENQDTSSVCKFTIDDVKYTLIIMCDGHGDEGKLYADKTAIDLQIMIREKIDEVLLDPYHVINEICANYTKQLTETHKDKDGGTTVTISIFCDGRLIVANIGDCEAILKTDVPESIVVERNGALIEKEMIDGCIHATTRHDCLNPSEVHRILEEGSTITYASNSSRVQPIDAYTRIIENGITKYERVPHVRQKGGYINNVSGDPAMYIRDRDTGKMMNLTRSLGDPGAGFLSSTPDVTIITWTRGNRARLVVGTDGYFNCLSDDGQINDLSFNNTPNIICERAYKAVGDTFTHADGDNMTICICDIPPY